MDWYRKAGTGYQVTFEGGVPTRWVRVPEDHPMTWTEYVENTPAGVFALIHRWRWRKPMDIAPLLHIGPGVTALIGGGGKTTLM